MLYLRIISILSIHLISSSRHQISSEKTTFCILQNQTTELAAGGKMSLIKGNVARLSEDLIYYAVALQLGTRSTEN